MKDEAREDGGRQGGGESQGHFRPPRHAAVSREPPTTPSESYPDLSQVARLQRLAGNGAASRVVEEWSRARREEAAGSYPVGTETSRLIAAECGVGAAIPSGVARDIASEVGAEAESAAREVRIHDDARADQLAQTVNARAFVAGTDLFFRQSSLDTSTASGRSVLAHELSHASSPVARATFAESREPGVFRMNDMTMLPSLYSPSPERPAIPPVPLKDPELIDQIKAINIQKHVWQLGDWNLEDLWEQYGNDLPAKANEHSGEWLKSVEHGMNVDNFVSGVKEIKQQLQFDVEERSRLYLATNLEMIRRERLKLGLADLLSSGTPSPEQASAREELSRKAAELDRRIADRKKLLAICVGWNVVPSRVVAYGLGAVVTTPYRIRQTFIPGRPPEESPDPDDKDMQPYADVQTQWQQQTWAIMQLAGSSPALYGAMTRDTLGLIAGRAPSGSVLESLRYKSPETMVMGELGVDPGTRAADETLGAMYEKVKETEESPPDWRELKLLISRFMNGQELGKYPWFQPFYQGIVKDEIGDYENVELAKSLGIGLAAAVGFIAAELLSLGGASPLLVAAAAGAGATGTALDVGMTFSKWSELESAYQSATSPNLTMVGEEQVDEAKLNAMISLGSAALDAFGLVKLSAKTARLVRAGVAGKEAAEGLIDQLAPKVFQTLGPEESGQVLSRGVLELGVQRVMDETGIKEAGELAAKVGGESTPAGQRVLKWAAQGGETALQGARTSLADLVKGGVREAAGVSPHDIVLQALTSEGPMGVLRTVQKEGKANAWKTLTGLLGDNPNSPAMKWLQEWRDGLYREFQEYMGTLRQADDLGLMEMRTGTQVSAKNDLDISLLSKHAFEDKEAAEMWWMKRAGLTRDELNPMLKLTVFVDPRRSHLYETLPEATRKLVDEKVTRIQAQLKGKFEQLAALERAGGDAEAIAREMENLGIPTILADPRLSGFSQQMLSRRNDEIMNKLAKIPAGQEPPADLLEELALNTSLINLTSEEASMGSGTISKYVSNRPNVLPGEQTTKMPGMVGPEVALTPGQTFVAGLEESFQFRKAAEAFRETVPAVREGADARTLAGAIKGVGKHGERFTSCGVEIAGDLGEKATELADRFAQIVEQAKKGQISERLKGELNSTIGEIDDLTKQVLDLNDTLLDALGRAAKVQSNEDLATAIVHAARWRVAWAAFRESLVHGLSAWARGMRIAWSGESEPVPATVGGAAAEEGAEAATAEGERLPDTNPADPYAEYRKTYDVTYEAMGEYEVPANKLSRVVKVYKVKRGAWLSKIAAAEWNDPLLYNRLYRLTKEAEEAIEGKSYLSIPAERFDRDEIDPEEEFYALFDPSDLCTPLDLIAEKRKGFTGSASVDATDEKLTNSQ